jgi:flagellar FliL protein
MAKEAKEEATEEAVEKPAGGRKKLIVILIAIVMVVLLGGGVLAYLLLSPAAEEEGHEEAKAEEEHPPIYEKLETFTVNLADRETYLQVEVHLLVAEPSVQEKIKQRMPEVRNDVINLLSGKTPDELATQQGKDVLAEEVRTKINGLLAVKEPDKGVKKVLFNAFIIQ